MLVEDLVHDDDERWVNFMKLLTIMEYSLAPVTTVDKTSYLEILIEEFLVGFVRLYPGRPLVPKMHLPMWIR